jgi:AcrR family transcriptional regulator
MKRGTPGDADRVAKPLGRPRAFDADEALEAAMRVFWQNGYEGASLTQLTAAMGISRPSMYAVFGDKEALFRKVLDRYMEGPAAYVDKAMAAPTARATVERLLFGAIDLLTSSRTSYGCLIQQGALTCCEGADGIRRELRARRRAGEVLLRRRLEQGVTEGELSSGTDCVALSRYFVTIIRGLGVSAVSGINRDGLRDIARTSLAVWPANVSHQADVGAPLEEKPALKSKHRRTELIGGLQRKRRGPP